MRFVRSWFLREEVPAYLRDFLDIPALSPSEEERLLAETKAGDEDAKKQIVRANMRLVIQIARSYRRSSVSLEDLVQDGTIGLMQAAERFDAQKGYRFSTYATHWIRQSIGRAIMSKQRGK